MGKHALVDLAEQHAMDKEELPNLRNAKGRCSGCGVPVRGLDGELVNAGRGPWKRTYCVNCARLARAFGSFKEA